MLEEASNKRHPLLERVRFLSISAGNLDEFYMVRVAGLVDMLQTRSTLLSDDGLTPAEQLAAIRERASILMAHQQEVWASLQDELREAGIAVIEPGELTEGERIVARPVFHRPGLPDPDAARHRSGASLPVHPQRRLLGHPEAAAPATIARPLMALLPLPPQVDRFVRLPGAAIRFLPLEELIAIFLRACSRATR